jgi:hypothetical protein
LRKILLLLLTGLLLMVLGFRALELQSDHIYSSDDNLFRFLAGLGLFLLFLAFTLFIGVSAYLSRKLPAIRALLAGVTVLISAVATWKIVLSFVNVHYWTFSLLAVPFTCALSGALLAIAGAIRLIIPKFHHH